MTNPRDTGKYDAFTDSYIDTNVRIDFAWGNIPIQPNDDREDTLDPELDSHEIAIDGYAGYPQIDDIANSIVPPPRAPEDFESYSELLATLGLVAVQGSTVENTTGAGVNGWVASTSPEAGTLVPVGTEVTVNVLGTYVPPSPINHSIAGIRKQFGGSSLDYNMFYMFLQGQNHNLINGSVVNVTGSDVSAYNKDGWIVIAAENDNAFNTGGTKVTIFWNGVITETANGTGGTYTKVS